MWSFFNRIFKLDPHSGDTLDFRDLALLLSRTIQNFAFVVLRCGKWKLFFYSKLEFGTDAAKKCCQLSVNGLQRSN